jgi:hypothetical protein
VLFRFADEPKQTARADFLTGSVINSLRGYRALAKGRLSLDALAKHAPWNHDLSRTFQAIDSSVSGRDINVLSESLKAYDLAPDVHRSLPSVRRESTAREQLALDLALSNRIYASRSFFDPGLEAMAGSLTIHENSEVKFGFLSPMRRPKQQIGEPEGEEEGICPEGVALLLKGWEIGTDPRRFDYHEPSVGQKSGEQAMTSATKATSPLPVMPRFLTPEPAVITTKKVQQHFTQVDDVVSTQQSSQVELMASTQILPGPYGGRPAKKKAKKRMGGF